MNLLRSLMLCFSAGAAGGLVNSLVVVYAGSLGLTAILNVNINPALTLDWLYPRLVWGGLWGFLFLLPIIKGHLITRAFLISLAPTCMQLFWVFPQIGAGFGGQGLGLLTPLLVVIYNWIWGLTAIYILRLAR
jgi:hypothetical protein